MHIHIHVCACMHLGICTLTCVSANMTLDCPDAAQPGQNVTIVCTFTDVSYFAIRFYRHNDVCVRCPIYSKCDTLIQGYSAVVKTGEKATLTIESFNPKLDADTWTCSLMHKLTSTDSQCTIHSKYMQKQQLFHTYGVS